MDEDDLELEAEYREMLALRPAGFRWYEPHIGWLRYQLLEVRWLLCVYLFQMESINYFVYRHRLILPTRRAFDVSFMLHYMETHYGRQRASLWEKYRFWRLWLPGYGRELESFVKLWNKKRQTAKERKFLDYYIQANHHTLFALEELDMMGIFHDREFDEEVARNVQLQAQTVQETADKAGKPLPFWRVVWQLFSAAYMTLTAVFSFSLSLTIILGLPTISDDTLLIWIFGLFFAFQTLAVLIYLLIRKLLFGDARNG